MKATKSPAARTANRARQKRAGAALSATLFCAFSLYIAWHASHESQTRPVDELPMSSARGDDSPASAADADKPELVRRGEYLARVGDCAACHTADPSRPFAGGLAIDTPFGRIYTPNITPDRDTGIGQWSDTDFVRAMHEGIGKGGERLYPAFPYVEFTRVAGRDVLAIRAYLNTVAPVHYTAPANALRFPFNQRWLMILWNLFNFDESRFVPDPKQSAEFNRGAYLVEGLAHCEECHTPRNFMQGLRTTERFSGATQAGWQAYNITPDRAGGIGDWSDDALIAYLSTGVAAGHANAAGPMADVVQNSTQYFTREDLRSVVAYLRALPPVSGGKTRPRDAWGKRAADGITALRGAPVTTVNGLQLFAANCASCCQWTGAGMGTNAPGANDLARVILHGVARKTKDADVLMPACRDELGNGQVAAISNYVTKRFGNPQATITADPVAALRAEPR
ncbi:c-type cytochrome [Paraburkholderia lycopersici]|uniref:Cytochrome c, mono-and diheme variants n=1 Tax=Paraburkholderia lycopersici TaxID=416944 RepID=A0A1G6WMA4_9BURK|nr:cytochrome c [Paraburkholderia lycopersici]SDD66175.1 Cytochrome c, mono-and diheme variants [Paraburkholderia lycopersici]